MRILADLHISPRTITHLRSLGYDIVRVSEVLPIDISDKEIIDYAANDDRCIITQDMDFSKIIALSGKAHPSLISLRLSSSRIEYVSSRLEKVLPFVESDISQGVIVVVEDQQIRKRKLPLE